MKYYAAGYIPYTVPNIPVVAGDAVRRDVALSDGDLDADGQVGAADVQLVVNAVLGLDVAPIDADVDGRGLSATDIQAVVNQALGRAISR